MKFVNFEVFLVVEDKRLYCENNMSRSHDLVFKYWGYFNNCFTYQQLIISPVRPLNILKEIVNNFIFYFIF